MTPRQFTIHATRPTLPAAPLSLFRANPVEFALWLDPTRPTMTGAESLNIELRQSVTDNTIALARTTIVSPTGAGPFTLALSGAQLNQDLDGQAEKHFWLVVYVLDDLGETLDILWTAPIALREHGASQTTPLPPELIGVFTKDLADTLYQAKSAALTAWSAVTPAAGVAAFLAAPTSANLRAAVTDESGTGGLIFAGGNIGTATGSVTGNAGTATALQFARTINGVSFNGSANITVPAAAGTLTGSALASGVTSAAGLNSIGAGTNGLALVVGGDPGVLQVCPDGKGFIGSHAAVAGGAPCVYLSKNAYFNGSVWIQPNTAYSSLVLLQSATQWDFYTAPAGSGSAALGARIASLMGTGEFSTTGAILFKPPASIAPPAVGYMTFEATSNTSMRIRLMGSDGVVRSAVLALS